MTHTISLYYFPKGLRYTTPIAIIGATYLLYEGWKVWGVILLLVVVFILTAKYITTIDLGAKQFSDAFGFFGIDIVTERKKFQELNRIEVSKGNYTQNINTRASSRQLDWSDYTGTLIYDDSGSLDLVTTEDKTRLVNELKIYATSLKVDIEDKATGKVIFSPLSA